MMGKEKGENIAYLSGQGPLQTVTPEFLAEVFGVTDEDVREGTLQDMIDLLELDMPDVWFETTA